MAHRTLHRVGVVMCAMALVSACSDAAPAPSVRPDRPGPTSPSSATPSRTATPSAPPPSATAADEFEVAIADIPQEFTTPALEYTSDGHALIWSSGAGQPPSESAANLWHYVPGATEPTLLYSSPRRDSQLGILTGDGSGGYAFVEQNWQALPPAGWRMWYLADEATMPIVVDDGDVAQGLLPWIALTPDRMVWTALHETEHGVESQLLMASPPGTEPIILLTTDPIETELLFPSIDGDRLVYSTLTVRPNRGGVDSDVYLLDLSDADPRPRRLNGKNDAFMGVIRGDTVVWLRPTEGSPLNGGRLVVYSIAEQASHGIALSPDERPLNFHSVGNRYVAAWSELETRLYVYDLESRASRLVEDLGDAPEGFREASNHRPRVGGDFLVYVQGSDTPGVDLTLRWARLPPGGAWAAP